MLTDFEHEAIDLSRRIQAVIDDSQASDELARYALAIATVLCHRADLPVLIRVSRNQHDVRCVEVEVLPGRVQ